MKYDLDGSFEPPEENDLVRSFEPDEEYDQDGLFESSKGGAYRLNFPFFHLVKEMYGEKVGQKRMDNEFKMATVDGWKLKV